MPNVSAVKAKFFEPDGLRCMIRCLQQVQLTTLVIADGGPYGNLTETITIIIKLLVIIVEDTFHDYRN